MIDHFDTALIHFEADVRSGKAAVQVVRKNDAARSGGGVPARDSGGGALSWPWILALLGLVTARSVLRQLNSRRSQRLEGMA